MSDQATGTGGGAGVYYTIPKITYRIPTNDQYAFVEVTEEFEGGPEFIRERYDEISAQFKSGEGLPQKEWCAVMDAYVSTGKVENGVEVWSRMSKYQQAVIQELKRCFNRTNK